MRHSVNRSRASAALGLLALASTTLSACHRMSPAGENPTMALLRDGSDKVCIAADVQAALRKAVLPKETEINGGSSPEERLKAINTVSFSYDLTTLQSFDTTVSKATCSTTAQIGGYDNKSTKFHLVYTITPSADDAGAFVLTTDSADAHAFATDLVGDALDDAIAKRQVERDIADDAQAHARLLATLSERWLTGTWIDSNQASSVCSTMQAMRLERGHVLEGTLGLGRWSLVGDQLHVIGENGGKHLDVTATITKADPVSFTMQIAQDTPISVRRCTTQEEAGPDNSAIEDDSAAEETPHG